MVNPPLTKDVGFLVYPSGFITTVKNSKVKFDKVDRNDGQGYSEKTGIFSAPVAGMYHFFWNLLSYGGRTNRIHLMLNGETKVISVVIAKKMWVTPSGSVYLRLKKDDQVYLQADDSGGKYQLGRFTTFGGELIRS